MSADIIVITAVVGAMVLADLVSLLRGRQLAAGGPMMGLYGAITSIWATGPSPASG